MTPLVKGLGRHPGRQVEYGNFCNQSQISCSQLSEIFSGQSEDLAGFLAQIKLYLWLYSCEFPQWSSKNLLGHFPWICIAIAATDDSIDNRSEPPAGRLWEFHLKADNFNKDDNGDEDDDDKVYKTFYKW